MKLSEEMQGNKLVANVSPQTFNLTLISRPCMDYDIYAGNGHLYKVEIDIDDNEYGQPMAVWTYTEIL